MNLNKIQEKYGHFYIQMLIADGKAIDFYQKSRLVKARETQPMWIYNRDEH
ncbi:hypothetical protein [Aquimarina longa]|uniref:hypothetical protein n=1 Tax=Aquimarina longa TaxID=1080221 RepID=UPI000AEBE3BB|nr:hypothetical protein [Aquimarina longa]